MIENVSIEVMLISAAVLLGAMLVFTTVAIRISCWLYNRVNGLAPPGLGRSDSRDYTLVASPDLRFYTPPRALNRYDRATSAAGGVPLPGVGRSIGIGVTFSVAFSALFWLLVLVIGAAGRAAGSTEGMSLLLANLVGLPLYVLLLSGLTTALLPTTFPRALLVAFVYFLLLLMLVSLLAVAAILIALALDIRPTWL